tara:strand:+ start:2602 stop:2784 length:183 start_codon:yes stop_codon:yes gene_type:complete
LEKDNYLNLSKDFTRSSSFLIDLFAKNKNGNDETNKKNPIWKVCPTKTTFSKESIKFLRL